MAEGKTDTSVDKVEPQLGPLAARIKRGPPPARPVSSPALAEPVETEEERIDRLNKKIATMTQRDLQPDTMAKDTTPEGMPNVGRQKK
jgi:hypothetical protein